MRTKKAERDPGKFEIDTEQRIKEIAVAIPFTNTVVYANCGLI
jgi:hypothetical protein